MMRWLAVGIGIVLLAGCIDGAPSPDEGPTGQIDGAVVNHVLVPYANATVLLPDLGRQTQTTPLGGFSFFDVPVGFHTLEVRLADGVDRQVVLVEQDDIARVILQVFPPPELRAYVTALSKTSVVDLAMPGEECEDCGWRTSLRERRPDLVELIVAWDGQHPAASLAETHLIVELRDEDGTLLAGPLGRDHVIRGASFLLCAQVPGSRLPADAGSLQLRFWFDPDNELPHPDLRFESHLRLHYADDELAC